MTVDQRTTGQAAINHSTRPTTGAIKVHAIQTGSVRVRQKQVRGEGSGRGRLLRTMLDREWSEWLPIYAWLIEHPEGLIVIDTGETARTGERDYFPRWHPYYRRGVEFDVTPEQEIGPQLENRWIRPDDVGRVVMTHLHTDHAGGLHHFPNSEILVKRSAFQQASGMMGRLRGFLPHRWPDRFEPTLFELRPTPFGPFPKSLPLTEAGDVVIVPTPGHTPNHVSVIVRTDDVSYVLAGDASYNEQLMLDGHVDGISGDEDAARATLMTMREFVQQRPTIYLPSHDLESGRRLAKRTTA